MVGKMDFEDMSPGSHNSTGILPINNTRKFTKSHLIALSIYPNFNIRSEHCASTHTNRLYIMKHEQDYMCIYYTDLK